jgi:hypothetical protein
MENVDQMIVDYYQSEGFRQDLLSWVETPRKSANLRRHIVLQMNANRLASGQHLTPERQGVQDRFIAGEMGYDELVGFMQEYVATIPIRPAK